MKFYKIRHKPTGLFFKPNNQSVNLSKKGKVYENKPGLNRLPKNWRTGYYRITIRDNGRRVVIYVPPEDFEIVEYNVTE